MYNYIRMKLCRHVTTSVCVRVHIMYVCMYVFIYVCMYDCTCVCTLLCVRIYACICMCLCILCIYMCVCVCVCVYRGGTSYGTGGDVPPLLAVVGGTRVYIDLGVQGGT